MRKTNPLDYILFLDIYYHYFKICICIYVHLAEYAVRQVLMRTGDREVKSSGTPRDGVTCGCEPESCVR